MTCASICLGIEASDNVFEVSHHDIQVAGRAVAETLERDCYNMTVKDIGWNWIEGDLPTSSRSVRQTAMLCVSRTMIDGQLVSAFTKGQLWMRGGVYANVPVLQPGKYVDPRAPDEMTPAGFGVDPTMSMSLEAELKQHVSGVGMYKTAVALTLKSTERCSSSVPGVLEHDASVCTASIGSLSKVLARLFEGVHIGRQGCMIVDLVPYDGTVGEAVVELRSEEGSPSTMGCMSAIWAGSTDDKASIATYVTKFTKQALFQAVTSLDAGVPGATNIGPERDLSFFGSLKPLLDDAKFNNTRPMTDGTLRLLQSVHIQWGDDQHYKTQFDTLANSHNSKFNPGGVPFKTSNKRTADEMGSSDDSKAVSLAGVPGVPITKDLVLEAHPDIVQIIGSSPSFELLVSKDGSLYMHGLEDSVVSTELMLCGCGDGVYDLGNAAQKTKSSDSGMLN